MGIRRLALAVSCAACGISVVGVAPLDIDAGDEAGLPLPASDASLPDGSAAPDDDDDAVDGGGEEGGGGSAPVAIANAGTVVAPTGYAQQTHLVHAENGKRWWLFTISSAAASALQAWSSTDFAAWVPATDLALPQAHKGQGANFTVAYAAFGTRDVVHLGMGLSRTGSAKTHYHARASLSNASIAWSNLAGVSDTDDPLLVDPEGAATLILPSGRVMDFTGWAPYNGVQGSTGNQNAFRSSNADTGDSWSAGFGDRIDIATAARTVNARMAFVVTGGVLAIWESGDDPEPNPANLRWSRAAPDTWTTPQSIFSSERFDVNDWSATALAPSDVHAIRRTPSGFQHRRFDGTSWSAGAAIAPVPGGAKVGAGLVVLHDATRVALATIAGDGSIQLVYWSPAGWSAWQTVVPPRSTPARSALSGWWSPTAGIGLVWTESDTTDTRVAGTRVPPG